MSPWRMRCPEGHASLETRGEDRYHCRSCGCQYAAGPFDAREVEFPVSGVDSHTTPDADDVLAALAAATDSRPAAPARDLRTPLRASAQQLTALRDRGLVETVDVTGHAARWRLTAAGRRQVGGSGGEQLVADGGRPAADTGEHDMSDSDDARDSDEPSQFDNTDILQSKESVVEQLRELSRKHEDALSESEQSALKCADCWIRSMEDFNAE